LDALAVAGFKAKGCDAVIFGAGGAARAVGWSLGSVKAKRVNLAARSPQKAGALVKALKKNFPGTEFQVGQAPAALWVNATPLGMEGFPDESPAVGSKCRMAFDLVYGRKTKFLCEAEAAGAKTANGLSMLVFQALRAWEFWFKPLGEARRKTIARGILKELS
jgi:shikimate dehydrogenase